MSDAVMSEAPAATTAMAAASAKPAKAKKEPNKADLKAKALKQVEFYFGDGNFPFDKFLFMLARKNDGWVPIDTVMTFKRFKHFAKDLSKEDVVTALRQSVELLEVDEKGENVKRKLPLKPHPDSFERSVYVKGFPIDENGTMSESKQGLQLQADLEEFFDKFGSIVSVRMRRYEPKHAKAKQFKGSVFTEFEKPEDMKKFLELDPKPKFKEDGEPLLIMSKKDYVEMKMKEKGITSESNRGQQFRPFNAFHELKKEKQGLPAFQDDNHKGYHNSNKRKRDGEGDDEEDDEERNKRKRTPYERRSDPLEFEYLNNKLTTRSDGTIDPEQLQVPEKSVLAFEGAGAEGNWRDLKETLLTIAPTSFVEFPVGAVSGAVGFKSTVDEDTFNTIKDRKIQVGGKEITWTRVDEEKAKQFYLDRANFRAKNLLDKRQEEQQAEWSQRYHNGGGRGGFGFRGNGRGNFNHRGGRGFNRGGRGNNFRGRGSRGGNRGGASGGGDAPSGAPTGPSGGSGSTD